MATLEARREGRWMTVGSKGRLENDLFSDIRENQVSSDQPASSITYEGRKEPKPQWKLVLSASRAQEKVRERRRTENRSVHHLGADSHRPNHAGYPRKARQRVKSTPVDIPVEPERDGSVGIPVETELNGPDQPLVSCSGVTILKRGKRLPRFAISLASSSDFPSLGEENVRMSAISSRGFGNLAWSDTHRGSKAPNCKKSPSPAGSQIHGRAETHRAYSEIASFANREQLSKESQKCAVVKETRDNANLRLDSVSVPLGISSCPVMSPDTKYCRVDGEYRVVQGATCSDSTANKPSMDPATAVTKRTPRMKKHRETEKRLLKKLQKKESRALQQRMNANRDTHVQLVTPRFLENCSGWRRRQQSRSAQLANISALDEYPVLGDIAASRTVVHETSRTTGHQQHAQQDDYIAPNTEAPKSYSRMLLKTPKTRPAVGKSLKAKRTSVPSSRVKRLAGSAIEADLLTLVGEKVRRQPEEDEVPRDRRRIKETALPRRGKTRLEPRKKKASPLKRVILQERAERRRMAGVVVAAGGRVISVVEEDVREESDHEEVGGAVAAGGSVIGVVEDNLQKRSYSEEEKPLSTGQTIVARCAEAVNGFHRGICESSGDVVACNVRGSSVDMMSSDTPEATEPAQTAVEAESGRVLSVPQQIAADTLLSVGEHVAEGAGDAADPPCRGTEYTPHMVIDAKLLIHNRKYRDYCQQVLSPEIDQTAKLLLQDLSRFQERLYLRDPIKARSRRRLVFGLKEVIKNLTLNKLKCVILAPNIENIEAEGGLNSMVQKLLSTASEHSVPIVIALKRRQLGACCKKPVAVSCIGLINYQGSEDNFKQLMQLTEAAQEKYRVILEHTEQLLCPPKQTTYSSADRLLNVFDRLSCLDVPLALSSSILSADDSSLARMDEHLSVV